LGKTPGVIYSCIAILPIIISSWNTGFVFTSNPEELASPGFEIINVLNFVTILAAHYFFYSAFDENLREKENLNKELREAAAEAKHLAEIRKDFVSTMSHELRTPLNAVLGITELLLAYPHNDNQKDQLNILRYSASDPLSLVNNILDINKLDSNRLELEKTAFSFHRLISNLCAVLQLKADEKNLQLSVKSDVAIQQLVVNSDPTRLSQVMYNLVGNAIRFTEQGEVTVQLQLLSANDQRAIISVMVTDTGVGIAPFRQQAIFDPFTQAGKDTTRKYGGTGLGLAIVKQILSLFNSTISLASAPGKGSTFSFTLDLEIASTTEQARNADEGVARQADSGVFEIVLPGAVDDELVSRHQVSLALWSDRTDVRFVTVEPCGDV